MKTVQTRGVVGHGIATLGSIGTTYNGGLTVLPPPHTVARVQSWNYRWAKRGFDIFCSLMMILIALIPGLLIVIAITFTSKGPVFYRETRVGQGGRLFRIWKFRSMCEGVNWQTSNKVDPTSGALLQWRIYKQKSDPRITPIGGLLRRWSLDEIPQLINVLKGDMSLIGPRPVVEAEVPMYAHLHHFYLAAVPGMSGLWQVSGRSNVSFAARASLDALYVSNWSLRSDFLILLRTVPAVLGRVGAR